MRYFYLLIALCFVAPARSQAPYQCLLPGAKQYFSNDMHYLRGMRIDSVHSIGSATVYYPFRTRRVRNGYQADSTGGSWLGKEARVYAGGRTGFLNYWNDTVVINTLADTGESWTFYSDSSSLYYVAKVTRIDSATINGVPDSVKTIQLSAMQAGLPVAGNPINNYRILLSKAHGFREIFDLYTFPYTKPGGQPLNTAIDYFLMINPYQQPAYAVFRPIEYRNPLYSELYDFEPGDVFQRARLRQEVIATGYTVTNVVQDSIATKTRVPDGIQYGCTSMSYQRTSYDNPNQQTTESYAGPGPSTRFYPDLPVMVLDTAIMPEEGMQQSVYFYDPADTSRCTVSASYRRVGYLFPIPLDGPPRESASYKVGFGLTDSTGGISYTAGQFSYHRQGLTAKKAAAPSCNSFTPLAVTNAEVLSAVRIAPNPASGQVQVTLPAALSGGRMTITDVTGRVVVAAALAGTQTLVPLQHLPAGVYMIRIHAGPEWSLRKLVVTH